MCAQVRVSGAAGAARLALVAALGLSAGAGLAARATAAAESPLGGRPASLEYRGTALARRQVEALLGDALRAPGDSARLARGLGRVVATLQDIGHLDARASASWSATSPSALRLDVVEGARHRWREVGLNVGGAEDSARVAESLELPWNGWVSPRLIGARLEQAVRTLADEGYPYAHLAPAQLDWDSAGARLGIRGGSGPLVTLSGLRFDGLKVTRRETAERAVGAVEGRPYSRGAAEAGRLRLMQLGLFRAVRFDGLEGDHDPARARLVYAVEEPTYNRLETALGLQGEGELAGLARLDLGNLAGTGRAAGLRFESLRPGVAEFGARYVEPLVWGAPMRLEFGIDQHVEDTLYTTTRWGGTLQIAATPRERLGLSYHEERVVQPIGDVRSASVRSTGFTLERDTRDQPQGARRGTRGQLQGEQSFRDERLASGMERRSQVSSVRVLGEWLQPAGRGPSPRAGLALELTGAGRFSSTGMVPLDQRLQVGGAASLRGHDEGEFRVDRVLLSRLEWRWFLGARGQRIALFWDHAAMATRLGTTEAPGALATEQRDGVGFGLRLEAPAALIGIDYGLEPGRPPIEGKIHLQLISSF